MSKRMKLRHKVLKCAVENMKFAKSFCHGAIGCALMGNTLGYDYDRDKQHINMQCKLKNFANILFMRRI